MQIKNHVPSLETCKRMKELGWDMHPCQFVWDCSYRGEYEVEHTSNHGGYHWGTLSLPAPLLSEIIDALPEQITVPDFGECDLTLLYGYRRSGEKELEVSYMCESFHEAYLFWHKNPAEAAALLWIKLVEEGIISSNAKE